MFLHLIAAVKTQNRERSFRFRHVPHFNRNFLGCAKNNCCFICFGWENLSLLSSPKLETLKIVCESGEDKLAHWG